MMNRKLTSLWRRDPFKCLVMTLACIILIVATWNLWFPPAIPVFFSFVHVFPDWEATIRRPILRAMIIRTIERSLEPGRNAETRARMLRQLQEAPFSLDSFQNSIITCLWADDRQVAEQAAELVGERRLISAKIEHELDTMIAYGDWREKLARNTRYQLDYPFLHYSVNTGKVGRLIYRNQEIIDDVFRVGDNLDGHPVSNRTFNSGVQYSVYAMKRPYELTRGPEFIGVTPAEAGLQIPECNYWVVRLRRRLNIKEIVMDIKEQSISGLEFSRETTDEDLQHLKDFDELQAIYLSDCYRISDDGMRNIAHLDKLRVLKLDGTRITDEGLAHLSGLTSLEELYIGGANITDAGLHNLIHLENLKKLYIVNAALITDEGFEALKNLKSLETFMITESQITDYGIQHFKHLENLQFVVLESCENITDDGLKYLRDLEKLQMLSLWNMEGLTDDSLGHIQYMNSLKMLSISNIRITSAGLKHLEALSQLQILELSNTDIDDSGLASLKRLSNLISLDIGGQRNITDSGLKHIGAMTSLRSLSLPYSGITDQGLEHLRGLNNLKYLDISRTFINGDGLSYLKDIESLTHLNLWRTLIDDDALKHLKELGNLTSLDLSGTKITNAGLIYLKELMNLETIRMLRCDLLGNSNVNDLDLKLSGTIIHWNRFGSTKYYDELKTAND